MPAILLCEKGNLKAFHLMSPQKKKREKGAKEQKGSETLSDGWQGFRLMVGLGLSGGTLWEERYKSCLVDSERYLLTCCRYIELNPARAAMVVAPGDYPWSSYRANAEGRTDRIVQPHDEYARLGATVNERCAAYRALFLEAIGEDRMSEIRAYVQQQRALGTRRFQDAIEAELQRVATVRPRGWPPGKSRDTESGHE